MKLISANGVINLYFPMAVTYLNEIMNKLNGKTLISLKVELLDRSLSQNTRMA